MISAVVAMTMAWTGVLLIGVTAADGTTTPNGTDIRGGISSVEATKRDLGGQTTGPTDGTEVVNDGGNNVVYQSIIACYSDSSDGVCSNPVTCDDPPGAVLYTQLASVDGGPFEVVRTICMRPQDVDETADAPPVVTPALVAEEFKRLTWPAATVQVQPPGGRTLVNLETNFYTADTGPQVQAVTLLGQGVEIEATPTTWTWIHGDGTTQTTSEPGRAYPDLDITHTYTAATDQPLALGVDTTYAGRYRLDGGPWTTIPATVTVAGPSAPLQVVTARPQLVGAG